ncbi:MAG: type IV pilus twitching motility protein PilT, partial [Armatimonadetes bacterium]|nr:type IV pilus twitching motility protein PilT [Armatimonadota bacterium]
MEIQQCFHALLEWGGSDLHLKVGLPPAMRVKGRLERTDWEVLTQEEMYRWIQGIAPPEAFGKLQRDKEADFSYNLEGYSRFRCNVFHQMGRMGGVFRVIPKDIPSLEKLGMPDILRDLTETEHGIVLVTGPTGSGKSTTLAAMINYINERHKKHILTIEDPIEFVHQDKMSILNQREVGQDTPSFGEALRRALRQDPDIILVGEMRDQETISIAMTAAETGHLVFSTLHTNDAKQSVDRIINTFPPEEQHQVRMKLAHTLHGVVAQRLARKKDGSGRVAVQEIMINSPTIRKLIEEGKVAAIDKALEDGAEFYGMQSMNLHLLRLWEQGFISEEDAYQISNNPSDLRLKMQTNKFAST